MKIYFLTFYFFECVEVLLYIFAKVHMWQSEEELKSSVSIPFSYMLCCVPQQANWSMRFLYSTISDSHLPKEYQDHRCILLHLVSGSVLNSSCLWSNAALTELPFQPRLLFEEMQRFHLFTHMLIPERHKEKHSKAKAGSYR